MKILVSVFALVGLFSLTACNMFSMPSKMNDMRSEMNDMSAKTGQLAHDAHLQVLHDSWVDMLSPENTMVPDNPVGMIKGGKAFAEEATPEELAQIVEVTLQDINQNQPDDSSKVNGKIPDNLVAEMEQHKIAELTALQVIMGFAPQSSVAAMVETQIRDEGRYERASYSALMLRALFIQGYRFGVALHDQGIQNVGEMKDAVDLTEQVEYIVELGKSITDKIGLKVTMLVPSDNIEVQLDTRMTADMWNGIESDANNHVAFRLTTPAEKSEFLRLSKRVEGYVQFYKPKK